MVVADRFEAESTSTIKRAASLLEPLMILVMGLLVGFIVISMLIAVFSINEIPI
jgi:general secretion pathway protein F